MYVHQTTIPAVSERLATQPMHKAEAVGVLKKKDPDSVLEYHSGQQYDVFETRSFTVSSYFKIQHEMARKGIVQIRGRPSDNTYPKQDRILRSVMGVRSDATGATKTLSRGGECCCHTTVATRSFQPHTIRPQNGRRVQIGGYSEHEEPRRQVAVAAWLRECWGKICVLNSSRNDVENRLKIDT